MSFDRNVDCDKRFVSSEPLSLEQRTSAGKELHSMGAEYLKDWFRTVLLDVTAGRQSNALRRSGGVSWLTGRETGEI